MYTAPMLDMFPTDDVKLELDAVWLGEEAFTGSPASNVDNALLQVS